MSNEISHLKSITYSTNFNCSQDQIKCDKNNQTHVINTGVVRNLTIFFSQTSTLSNSLITTSNKNCKNLKMKKSYENLEDLKISQSEAFKKVINDREFHRTESNDYFNEIERTDINVFFSEQVKINHFTKRNSLTKYYKLCKNKKFDGNFIKKTEAEMNEYKRSLKYLDDEIDDENEQLKSIFLIKKEEIDCGLSDNYIDFYNKNRKKDKLLNETNVNEVKKKKDNDFQYFNEKKFEKKITNIFSLMVNN